MTDKPNAVRAEPVAWLVISGDARVICMSEGTAEARAFDLRKGGYLASVEPLYPESVVAELELEVERLHKLNSDLVNMCNQLNLGGAHSDQRAVTAERRLWEAQELCNTVLATLQRNLASEAACGHPFMGDDEHEAIRLLTNYLTQPEPSAS